MPHRYEEIAADLERRIDNGEWPVGTKMPGINALAREYEVGNGPMQEAFAVLELRGRVVARVGRGGTIVLDADAPREKVDWGQQVRRNEYGYLFGKPTGHWDPVGNPQHDWKPCPADVAARLNVDAGSPVLTRYRVVGLGGEPMQITTTYIPEDLARGTVLEQTDTGPGGWLDRVEQDMGHGPVTWDVELTARLPTDDEATALGVSSKLPVLELNRLATSVKGSPVGLDIAVLDARRFSMQFPLTRATKAQWPTTPATARNRPAN